MSEGIPRTGSWSGALALALLAVGCGAIGCSALFDGGKHQSGMDGGAGADAGEGDAGLAPCVDHGDCIDMPGEVYVCADRGEGRRCYESCLSTEECADNPLGAVCLAGFCSCENAGDCPDSDLPFCSDGLCVECQGDDACGGSTPICGVDGFCRGCVNPTECGPSSSCVGGACVAESCDEDSDGFSIMAPGCPSTGPFDCDDTNPDVYPGALPTCGNSVMEPCPGGPLKPIFRGADEVGTSPFVIVAMLEVRSEDEYRLDVTIDPQSALAAHVVYHVADGGSEARILTVDAGSSVTSAPATPTEVSTWPRVDTFALARGGSLVHSAAVGETSTSMAAVFPNRLSGSSRTLRPTALPGVDLIGDTLSSTAFFRDEDAGSVPTLVRLDGMGTARTIVSSLPSDPAWIAAAAGLVVANDDNGAVLWPHQGGMNAVDLPGASSRYRGDIEQLPGGGYVLIAPGPTGITAQALDADCGNPARTGACVAATTPLRVGGDETGLPALAPGAGESVLLATRESPMGSSVRLRRLTSGTLDSVGLDVVQLTAPNRIYDVAIDSYEAGGQLEVVIAIVAGDMTRREVRVARIRACSP